MLEYGRIEHNGQSFVNLGAVVQGKHVTGYQRGNVLTTWQGRTMVESRFLEFDEYYCAGEFGDKCRAVAWLLTNKRAIVGLSLGDGMLFRGELVTQIESREELQSAAENEALYWLRIDADDYERDQFEQLQESVDEEYQQA